MFGPEKNLHLFPKTKLLFYTAISISKLACFLAGKEERKSMYIMKKQQSQQNRINNTKSNQKPDKVNFFGFQFMYANTVVTF